MLFMCELTCTKSGVTQAPQSLRMTQPCAKPEYSQDDGRLKKRLIVLYMSSDGATHVR